MCPYKRQGDVMMEAEREEKMLGLLALKREDRAISQGMHTASRTWKMQRNRFFPRASRWRGTSWTHIRLLTSGTVGK